MASNPIFVPGGQACSRNLPGVEGDTYLTELLFTGRCSGSKALCGPCPVLSRNPRTMRMAVAEQAVRQGAVCAKSRGFSAMRVQLVGADPLAAFEALGELAAAVGLWTEGLPVTLGFTTCSELPEPSVQAWLLENKEWIRCSFRWNGTEGKRRWLAGERLWSRIVDTVIWSVRPDTLDAMYDELQYLLKSQLQVRLEYPDLSGWRLLDLERYVQVLNRLTREEGKKILESAPGCRRCTAQIPCAGLTDIGGKTYPCRLLSSERMSYSELQSRVGNAALSDAPAEKEWCPAERELSRQRLCLLFHRLHLAKLGRCMKG